MIWRESGDGEQDIKCNKGSEYERMDKKIF